MGYFTQALNRQRPLIRMDSSSRTNGIMGYLTQALNRQRPLIRMDSSPGGYSVERWVLGCAAQIGYIFSPTGFSMTPFYFKTRF